MIETYFAGLSVGLIMTNNQSKKAVKQRKNSPETDGNISKTNIARQSTTNRQNEQQAIPQSTTRSQFVRNFIRRLIILGIAAAATYLALLSKEDPYLPFAKSVDAVSRRSFQVPCSDDYAKEPREWQECIPRRCGRVVMDSLFSSKDIDQLLRIAKKGFRLGGSNSGFVTLDLHSGVLSSSNAYTNIYKLPEASGIFTLKDFAILGKLRSAIQLRVTLEFGASPHKLYLTHPISFSRITTSKTLRPAHDEYWRPRVDKRTHRAWHYTSLIDLGTYGEDFKGGRFVLVDDGVNRTVEPRKGRMSLFTSGSENLHYIERLQSGERYFLTIVFTCDIRSAIPDPSLRNLNPAT